MIGLKARFVAEAREARFSPSTARACNGIERCVYRAALAVDRLKLDLLGAEGVAEGASGGRAAGRRPVKRKTGRRPHANGRWPAVASLISVKLSLP